MNKGAKPAIKKVDPDTKCRKSQQTMDRRHFSCWGNFTESDGRSGDLPPDSLAIPDLIVVSGTA